MLWICSVGGSSCMFHSVNLTSYEYDVKGYFKFGQIRYRIKHTEFCAQLVHDVDAGRL
jgi:hypothetical protein